MKILKKFKNLLVMHLESLKILANILFIDKSKRRTDSYSKYFWSVNIATNCGAYPITYPYSYPTPTHFISKLLTFNYLFRFLSYYNINKKLKKNNSVYVKTDELQYFQKHILPRIKIPFVLVTGASDYSTSMFRKILDNKYLIHWFAQHNDIEDTRITVLPAGIDFVTLISRKYFGEEKMSSKKQENILERIMKIKSKKEFKVFSNFHLNYTSQRRKELHDLFRNNPIIHFQKNKMPRTEMWKLQEKFAFNFSPAGNGLDAYRTWESLLLGQIPIVEKMGTDIDNLHKQFPIAIIEDISEINETNLKKWHKKYSKMFNAEMEKKLTNDYWNGLIKQSQKHPINN
jgi:hypothetical protein